PASALGLLRFDGLLPFLQAFPGAVIVLQAVAQSAAQLAYLSQRCLPGCQLPGQLLQRLLGQLPGLLRREALTAVADARLQLGVAPLQLPGLTTQTLALSRRQYRRQIGLFIPEAGLHQRLGKVLFQPAQLRLTAADALLHGLHMGAQLVPLLLQRRVTLPRGFLRLLGVGDRPAQALLLGAGVAVIEQGPALVNEP